MSMVLRKPMTLADFLTWEEQQEVRHEFDGVQPVAMTGGTYEHDAIQVNLVTALNSRLRGKPCRVHGNSLKIRVMDSIRYPDAFVSCGPIPRGSLIVEDPVVVFEVVSAGSSRIDRIVKLNEYQATASIPRYVILEQDSIAATVFAREGTVWTARALVEGDTLSMLEIEVELPLVEIYGDVALPLGDDVGDEGL
ncbi:MAG TPA: Uma2 family endonuclease [Stellaceae bacterium]|nr:Uma2 family endonuclease [Stellaceae bacterium]